MCLLRGSASSSCTPPASTNSSANLLNSKHNSSIGQHEDAIKAAHLGFDTECRLNPSPELPMHSCHAERGDDPQLRGSLHGVITGQ